MALLTAVTLLLCLSGLSAIRLSLVADEQQAADKHEVQTDVDVEKRRPPAFCHGADCPRYSLIDTFNKGAIELRSYRTSVWVSTKLSGGGYDSQSRAGIKLLQKYFNGHNEDGLTLDETAPILVEAAPAKDGPYTQEGYVVSFLIPFDYQEDPPRPKDKRVFIERVRGGDYYVSTFDKWIDEYSLMTQVQSLFDGLDDNKLRFERNRFYSAVYNKPEDWQDRHNEVWVRSNDDNAAASA